MLLLLKNILFTVIMPGTIAVWLPLFWITDNTITEQILSRLDLLFEKN